MHLADEVGIDADLTRVAVARPVSLCQNCSMQSEEVGISIIVPAYNAEKCIGRCLDSLLASRYPRGSREVICVDNASSDQTASIVASYGPAVKLVRESRRGPAAARNAGVTAATQPIVAFTDADCAVDPGWLAAIVAPVAAGEADAVGGRILARRQAGAVERFGELVHDHAMAIEHSRPPYLITMNLATRAELLRSIGGFNERWIRLEDVELTYRLLDAGARLRYQPEAIVYHHNRDTVARLAREGFLHGYYRPEFLRTHRDFIARYRERHANQERLAARPTAASQLRPWQIRTLWGIFNFGKRAGEVAGRWFPPDTAARVGAE